MIVKLPTEHYLEFLSLKGGCRALSESTLVKMSNCWKSHATAHFFHFSPTVTKASVRPIQDSVNCCGVPLDESQIQSASKTSTRMVVNMVIVDTTGLPVNIYPARESKYFK